MNTKRRETRYFFSSNHLSEILISIRNILGQELLYPNSVTETIYFTLGRDADHAFPKGLRVRSRRYIEKLTRRIIIDDTPLFLEIKKEIQDGVNCKKRIETTGLGAVSMLKNGFDGLPKLVTYAATQSPRFHWLIGNSGRLTLDADIRLFGFDADGSLEADYVCDYSEGKLEFKLENEGNVSTELSIVRNTKCENHDYTYLERKTRQCMKKWLNATQD